MINYIEYLDVPVTLGLIIIGAFLIMQVIGEILEFKGKDVYMARRAGALSVLCKYSYNAKGQDELYSKLVAISHWTATDFEQEKAIKEICKAENIHPDYTIHAFDEILAIIQTLNTIPS